MQKVKKKRPRMAPFVKEECSLRTLVAFAARNLSWSTAFSPGVNPHEADDDGRTRFVGSRLESHESLSTFFVIFWPKEETRKVLSCMSLSPFQTSDESFNEYLPSLPSFLTPSRPSYKPDTFKDVVHKVIT